MATLCFFSKQNNDELTSRVFEIPACGGLLISEKTNRLSEIFTDGHDALFFSDINELNEKCLFLLNNPKKVLQIKSNGLNTIKNGNFSVIDRCEYALKIFKKELNID